MTPRQIEILLKNNELDFLIEILKYEQGRAIVSAPERAAKIGEILSKLYKLQKVLARTSQLEETLPNATLPRNLTTEHNP